MAYTISPGAIGIEKGIRLLGKECHNMGLNVFLGSAISLQLLPSFEYIRNEYCKCLFKQAGLDEKSYLFIEKDKRIRAETVFEDIALQIGERLIEGLSLLDNFAPQDANLAHLRIAALQRAGLVNTVFTTNWDSYLQAANRSLGPFRSTERRAAQDEVSELKLHGTLDSPRSMLLTLSHTSTLLRRRAIRLFLREFPLRPCLVIGYSGLDEDIRLALQKARSVQPLYWLCYKPKDIREITRLWKTYEGLPPLVLIKGELKKLLKLLCLEAGVELTEQGSRKRFDKSRFQKKLNRWASEIPVWQARLASARLLDSFSDSSNARTNAAVTRMAIKLAERVARSTLETDDSATFEGKALVARLLWNSSSNIRRPLSIARELIERYEGSTSKKEMQLLLEAQDIAADTLYKRGDLREALTQCKKGLELNPSHTGLLCTYGMILHDQNKFYEAAKVYRKAIRLCRQLGDYYPMMDALNLHSLTLSEITARQDRPLSQYAKKLVKELLEVRAELERLAKLYKSQFYLSCVLVNSAEDLYLAGDLQVALKKAYGAFQLDIRHRPEDSDTAVTYEILTRILLECYLFLGREDSKREILIAVQLLISRGLDLAAEWPEQRVCLQSLMAVVKSYQGDNGSDKALLDRCMSYSRHYEKIENIFWHHIHKAMVEVRFNRTDEVHEAFASALQMSQQHLYRRFYADRLRVVLWSDQPSKWQLTTDEISSLAKTGRILRGELSRMPKKSSRKRPSRVGSGSRKHDPYRILTTICKLPDMKSIMRVTNRVRALLQRP